MSTERTTRRFSPPQTDAERVALFIIKSEKERFLKLHVIGDEERVTARGVILLVEELLQSNRECTLLHLESRLEEVCGESEGPDDVAPRCARKAFDQVQTAHLLRSIQCR